MTKNDIKNKNTESKAELHCGNVLMIWDTLDFRRTEITIYYKTNDNLGNKEVNDIRTKGFWYTRTKLEPYKEFWELNEAFIKYQRRWVYVKEHNKEYREADKERWKHIRNAPFIWLNI